MQLIVRNVDFSYDKDGLVIGVNVRFDSNEPDGVFLSGTVKMTHAEYEGAENLVALANLSKVKLQEKVNESETTI